MARKYWYVPTKRPPQFGGMPDGALLERGRKFGTHVYEAWAYPQELDSETVERWSLKLVRIEDVCGKGC